MKKILPSETLTFSNQEEYLEVLNYARGYFNADDYDFSGTITIILKPKQTKR